MNIRRTAFGLIFLILVGVGFTLIPGGPTNFLRAAFAAGGDSDLALADTRQLEIEKIADVPALIAAVQKAKIDAQAISGSRSDAEHIEKAVRSLNDALTAGLTSENLEHFFNGVRQAIDALERVNAGTAIASNLAEASRVATEKFIANVERAIPRLADTRTREKAVEDFAKAKDDYARGVATISAGQRNEAINHFRQAMRRMVRYPLVSSTKPKLEFPDPATIAIVHPNGDRFLISIKPNVRVTQSPKGQLLSVVRVDNTRWAYDFEDIYDSRGRLIRSHEIRGSVDPAGAFDGFALADAGHFAQYQSVGVDGGNVVFHRADGSAFLNFRGLNGWFGEAGFVSDTILVLADGSHANRNPATGDQQGVEIVGYHFPTGQKLFTRKIDWTEAYLSPHRFGGNDEGWFEVIDTFEIDENQRIILRLVSAQDGLLHSYVFSANGELLEIQ